jgi:hypothetical protein
MKVRVKWHHYHGTKTLWSDCGRFAIFVPTDREPRWELRDHQRGQLLARHMAWREFYSTQQEAKRAAQAIQEGRKP